MKAILITGASGFLGRHTVARFRHMHPDVTIRAMARPNTPLDTLGWDNDPGIEVFRADIATPTGLREAVTGVDAVVHLAAIVRGSDADMRSGTVRGTEHLLQSMASARINRLILCSSFSVYNYRCIPKGGLLTEESPLMDEPDLAQRTGYAIAKTRQESITRAWANAQKAQLTILRPGFIWGAGHTQQPFLGTLGPVSAALAPHRYLALSYVENCADAFVTATMHPEAVGKVFNVVDAEDVTPMRYANDVLTHPHRRGWVVPVPYELAFGAARMATRIHTALGVGRLPSLLHTHRFEPRFKPFRVRKDKLRRELGWEQPVAYPEAVRRAA